MKRFFIILLLLLPFALFCDTSDSTIATDSNKTKKFEIGITFSPDYCFRKLKTDTESKWIADIRDTLETGKFGYTTGLNVVYNINKKFSVAAGVLFSDKGKRTKKYSLGNFNSANAPISNTYIYHYHSIDIPIKANYYILTEKIRFFITAGVSTTIFIAQKTTSKLEYRERNPEKSSSTNTSSAFTKINFSVIAGLGIDCAITDKFNFKMEPLYRRSITSIINAPIKEYLYSAGLNIGIYYKL